MVRNCSDVLIPIQHFHLRDLCLEHRQRFTKQCSASRKVCWHPEGGLPDLHQPDAVRFPPGDFPGWVGAVRGVPALRARIWHQGAGAVG